MTHRQSDQLIVPMRCVKARGGKGLTEKRSLHGDMEIALEARNLWQRDWRE